MPQAPKIPPELMAEVVARAGKGFTTRQTQEWLQHDHSISISARQIARYLEKRVVERREAVRSVVAEKLTPHVDADLVALGEIADRLRGYAKTAQTRRRLDWAIRASEAEANVRATRLKLAGAGVDEKPLEKSARDRLLEKLERIVNPAAS